MDVQLPLLLLLALPLAGAILNGFFFRRFHISWVATIATLAILIPFAISCNFFYQYWMNQDQVTLAFRENFFPWIRLDFSPAHSWVLNFGVTVDRLSSLYLMIITGIGSLIHIYSSGYMNHEKYPYRFFVYLNLFILSMLLLVLGSNMLVTFLGWEGVGVCSYLLIGYWYEESANASAAIKAFIMNRIGDLGFIIAMFLTYLLFQTLDYHELYQICTRLPPQLFAENQAFVMIIGLCLLLAVAGKSAQLPLYTWLPDAMAGPTPVSALIHAATMVTAGIYLLTRMSFLLIHDSTVMSVIAYMGAATAFLGATIGFAQTDIKKVLAYSTVSQLGYMVMACGVGAFDAAVAHVMTHAFFKALLFLGAGSVIYALHHEQDIRKMGGLFWKMPITGLTFLLGTLAIIGLPPFAGFFSKDAILYEAWSSPFGNKFLWAVGFVTAGMTSFYMVRLTVTVFFGKCRFDHPEHIHENKWPMTFPLMVLAILSTLGGAIIIPPLFTGNPAFISNWLEPVISHAKSFVLEGQHGHNATIEWILIFASIAIVVISSSLAWMIYRNGFDLAERISQKLGLLYRLVRDKWLVDEIYDFIFVKYLKDTALILDRWIERLVIESCVNGLPKTFYTFTAILSDGQKGFVRTYIKYMFFGLLVFFIVLIS